MAKYVRGGVGGSLGVWKSSDGKRSFATQSEAERYERKAGLSDTPKDGQKLKQPTNYHDAKRKDAAKQVEADRKKALDAISPEQRKSVIDAMNKPKPVASRPHLKTIKERAERSQQDLKAHKKKVAETRKLQTALDQQSEEGKRAASLYPDMPQTGGKPNAKEQQAAIDRQNA